MASPSTPYSFSDADGNTPGAKRNPKSGPKYDPLDPVPLKKSVKAVFDPGDVEHPRLRSTHGFLCDAESINAYCLNSYRLKPGMKTPEGPSYKTAEQYFLSLTFQYATEWCNKQPDYTPEQKQTNKELCNVHSKTIREAKTIETARSLADEALVKLPDKFQKLWHEGPGDEDDDTATPRLLALAGRELKNQAMMKTQIAKFCGCDATSMDHASKLQESDPHKIAIVYLHDKYWGVVPKGGGDYYGANKQGHILETLRGEMLSRRDWTTLHWDHPGQPCPKKDQHIPSDKPVELPADQVPRRPYIRRPDLEPPGYYLPANISPTRSLIDPPAGTEMIKSGRVWAPRKVDRGHEDDEDEDEDGPAGGKGKGEQGGEQEGEEEEDESEEDESEEDKGKQGEEEGEEEEDEEEEDEEEEDEEEDDPATGGEDEDEGEDDEETEDDEDGEEEPPRKKVRLH